ncbi:ribonuclease HII [Clostridium grantii]|uniref:Ribonuclease HII n=1 Tax=Clostridium grantii DSM 8605 TaxID=1121316 RepID=A0A1M5QWP4_9CLOT|nr:ribonuclease HII [Clostridium grantii]SHH18129.1 RNase HII [Clostridium grantii DSM 8605]
MNYDFSELKVNDIKNIVNNEVKKQKDHTSLIDALIKDERKSVNKLGQKMVNDLEKIRLEIVRVRNLYNFDVSFGNDILIAGVDEVGRGPLAGPIVAAAVVLKLNINDDKDLILQINDSKKINEKLREELAEIIKEKAIDYNIVELDNRIIDSKGIAFCNNEVLKKSVEGLKTQPSLVLSDGYAIKNCAIKNHYVIKGDSKSASIACASIIAKVYRDKIMKKMSGKYNQYSFEQNVGYGTKDHMNAILEFGPTEIHRLSFLKKLLYNNSI